jgi:hypothetical protein
MSNRERRPYPQWLKPDRFAIIMDGLMLAAARKAVPFKEFSFSAAC